MHTDEQSLHAKLEEIRQRVPPADSSPQLHSHSKPSNDAVLRLAKTAGSCRTLVVAFGSLGGQHDFQAACRRTGVEHALFIRDVKQAWFLLGVDDIGERSFAATLSAVAAEMSALQPRRLVLLGTSMGGYAAVRTALELQQCDVDEISVLVFAPQICIDPDERSGCLELPPMPFDANLHTAKRAWVAQGRGTRLPSAIDALLRQDGQRGPVRAIDVHVGSSSLADVYEAALLRRAAEEHPVGRVCVAVTTHEGMGHQLAEALRDDMLLDAILSDVVAGAARPCASPMDLGGA